MAFLSLVTGVVDSTGERVDLPQTDGTYLPIRLKLGQNLSGTPATNGGQTDVTIDAATVNASYAQVQAALATADADLEVGNSFGVAADHFSSGSDPSLSGALRTSGGELVTYRDSGVDRTALQGSATTVTVGNADSDADVLIGTGKAFQVTLNGVGTQLEVADVVTLYHGSTTHATATGEVGLDATGHLTVWTSGAESSLVAQSDALSGDLGGTVANPSVVKLQGTTVSAAPPALNNVLTYNGSNWAPAAPSGGGGGATVYPALDSHDLGYWDFSEASGNFANQGTAGSIDIVPIAGSTTYYGQATPFGSGAFIGQNGAASGVTTAFRPAQFTMIAFFRPFNSFNGSQTTLLAVYDVVANVTPFGAYWFNSSTNTDTMNWYAYFSQTGGGHTQIDVAGGDPGDWRAMPWREWVMMALTYDGSTYKVYLNGGLVASQASGTGPDYSTSNTKIDLRQNLLMGLFRIRDTAMSASDVRLAYRHAMGWA